MKATEKQILFMYQILVDSTDIDRAYTFPLEHRKQIADEIFNQQSNIVEDKMQENMEKHEKWKKNQIAMQQQISYGVCLKCGQFHSTGFACISTLT